MLLSVLHDFPAFWLLDKFQKNTSHNQVFEHKEEKKSSARDVKFPSLLQIMAAVCSGDQRLLQDVDC